MMISHKTRDSEYSRGHSVRRNNIVTLKTNSQKVLVGVASKQTSSGLMPPSWSMKKPKTARFVESSELI